MRLRRVSLFLGCAAFVALAAAAYSCGIYGGDAVEEILAKDARVPGPIMKSIIHGNVLVAVLLDKRLVTVDLTTGASKVLATIDAPAPMLDVAGNKVCVISKNRVMIVDLADGKTTQLGGVDHEITASGFLSSDRVFVQGGPQIKVIDVAGGNAVKKFSLGKADPKSHSMGFRTLGRSGKHLYVSVASEKGAVAVVDLETGNIADRCSAAELKVNAALTHHSDYVFAGDKVFVLSSRLAYGVWAETIGIIDLKSRQYTAIKMPSNTMSTPSLIPGPRNTVFLTSRNGTHQIDAGGNVTAILPSDERNEALLLGVWQGKGLVAERSERLRQVALPTATARVK